MFDSVYPACIAIRFYNATLLLLFFFFLKKTVFPPEVEYSYFSAHFRLNIFLNILSLYRMTFLFLNALVSGWC